MDQTGYDRQVSMIMTTLGANFAAVRRHAGGGGEREGEGDAQFAGLLGRAAPVTEAEKLVAATLRWLAGANRAVFTRLMFEGRCPYIGAFVDSQLVDVALNRPGITGDAGHLRRLAAGGRAARPGRGGGDRREGGGDRREGGGDRREGGPRGRREGGPRGGPRARREDESHPPVLGAAACLALLDELDAETRRAAEKPAPGAGAEKPAPGAETPAPDVSAEKPDASAEKAAPDVGAEKKAEAAEKAAPKAETPEPEAGAPAPGDADDLRTRAKLAEYTAGGGSWADMSDSDE